MRLGVHLVRFPWQDGPSAMRSGLVRVAESTEAVGATGLSLMDHHFGPPGRGPVDDPMLEGYTGLAFWAAVTTSVRLRLLVTGVTYRHPGLLVKTLTTLDVLSGGRAELGLGAAWYAREHHGLGIPFPPISERFERLEETIQIAARMWSDDKGPFHGRHYHLAETICSPPPLSRPRPRIVVGGGGERRTLSLVARYADACNLVAVSPPVVARKLEVLRRHCDAAGRPCDQVGTTIVYRGDLLTSGRHDDFVSLMAEYAALGAEEVFVIPAGPRPEGWIDKHVGAVVGRLAGLGP